MKKISNSIIKTALLRGAVLFSGSLCTICASLFCDDIYQAITVLFIGAGCVCLIDNRI